MECKYCHKPCAKAGKQYNGVQKYKCSCCSKYQQQKYIYKAYEVNSEEMIVRCLKAGCGIRSTREILNLSCTTIISKIREIASGLESNYNSEQKFVAEMDELYTYVGSKSQECWVIYAIDRRSKKVIEVVTGKRTTENVKRVVDKVMSFSPKKICTDRLNIYPGIIPKELHQAGRRITNKIERYNLTLRTRLKRLSRSTICYSKRIDMLESCLKIFFWS